MRDCRFDSLYRNVGIVMYRKGLSAHHNSSNDDKSRISCGQSLVDGVAIDVVVVPMVVVLGSTDDRLLDDHSIRRTCRSGVHVTPNQSHSDADVVNTALVLGHDL